jgi:quinol monooxygenase YgiN
MVTVGVVARFEAKPGTDAEMERFFHNGLSIVETQPSTTMWFAFRTGPTSYGAFAVFETDADREALLSAGGPKLSAEYAKLFAQPPSFEKADVLEARYAG